MSDQKRSLVRRYDTALLAGLLVSSGLAALLFWILAVDRLPESNAAQSIPAPIIEPLNAASLYADQPLRFSGMAQPGDKVLLLNQGQPIREVIADDAGVWQIFLESGLATGAYSLEVIAEDEDGIRSQAAPVSIQIQAWTTPTLAALPASITATLNPTHTPTLVLPSATATVPIPTASSTYTSTEEPSITPETIAQEPSATSTSQPTDTPTHQPSPTVPTNTRQPSATLSVSPTGTHTLEPSLTVASSLTSTLAPSRTPALRPSVSPAIVVQEPSITALALSTETSTIAPTRTATVATQAPSRTPTRQASRLATNTISPSRTPSPRVITGPTLTFTPFRRSVSQPIEPTRTATLLPVTPSITPFPLPTHVALAIDDPPIIDSPIDGGQVAAGLVMVSGTSAAQTAIQIRDNQGAVLGIAVSDGEGRWSLTVPLTVDTTFWAELVDSPDRQSDPVSLTVSPVLQPQTGATNDKSSGKITTTLIALLLSAMGAAMIYAGRLIYTLKELHDEN